MPHRRLICTICDRPFTADVQYEDDPAVCPECELQDVLHSEGEDGPESEE